jgi:hypothetical protein
LWWLNGRGGERSDEAIPRRVRTLIEIASLRSQ